MATAEQKQQLVALTTAMFDAPPGAEFLAEFEGYLDQGLSIEQIAANLAATDAFNSQFEGMDGDDAKINMVLEGFGIDTGSPAYQEAFNFFTESLAAGRNPGEVLSDAANFLNTTEDESFSEASATFKNKVQTGVTHSIELGLPSQDLTELKSALANVTSDPQSVAAAAQALNEKKAQQDQPQQPDEPEEEQPTDGEGPAAPGGVEDDVFTLAASEFVTTTGNEKALNGGEGNDKLIVEIPEAGSFDVSTLDFSQVSNIETLELSRTAGFELPSTAPVPLVFDLSNTSFNTLVIDAPFDLEGTFQINGNASLSSIVVKQPIGPDISEVTDTDTSANTRGEIDLDSFTNFKLTAEADITTTLDMTDSAGAKVSLSGAGNIDLGALVGTGITIDATSLTGSLMVLSSVNGSSIVGGSNNDVLTSSANGGSDFFAGLGGDDIIDLTAAISGQDTVVFWAGSDGSDGNDTILGFRAKNDAESDTLQFKGVSDAAALADGIKDITFVENGGYEMTPIDGNTVDMTINFQNGGSITFADFVADSTDVGLLFNGATFEDASGATPSDTAVGTSETVVVTGVTGAHITSAMDVEFA